MLMRETLVTRLTNDYTKKVFSLWTLFVESLLATNQTTLLCLKNRPSENQYLAMPSIRHI